MTHALTDTEFDRLEQLLDGFPDSLTLDSLQGFCAALASSPVPLAASQWQPIVLGGEDLPEAELAALLTRLYDETAGQLAAGEDFPFLVYGSDEDPEHPDYEGWCAGYIHGFTQTPAEILEETGVESDDIDDALHPIALLSGVLKESIDPAEWLKPEEEAEALAEAEEELGDAVRGLYRLFRAQ